MLIRSTVKSTPGLSVTPKHESVHRPRACGKGILFHCKYSECFLLFHWKMKQASKYALGKEKYFDVCDL